MDNGVAFVNSHGSDFNHPLPKDGSAAVPILQA